MDVDVHTPHGAAHSLKEFVYELFTITIGVLIALSLGGIVEWRHDRVLVREAKDNLRQEITDNQRELTSSVNDIPAKQANIDHVVDFVNDLLASKKADVREISLGVSMADLSEASWQTADRTGALGHMEYVDVQRYAQVYSLQTLFTDEQRTLLQQLTASLARIQNGDPSTTPKPDLEVLRSNLYALRAQLIVHQQIAQRLLDRYRQALQ